METTREEWLEASVIERDGPSVVVESCATTTGPARKETRR